MSLRSSISRATHAVTGTVKDFAGPVLGAVSGGMIANTLLGGIQGATTLAGVLGLGGGGQLPQPGSGPQGQQGGYGQDQGYQQNLASLAQMTGQQQPVMNVPMIGGGGLI